MRTLIILSVVSFGLVACDQFDPRADWEKYDSEKELASSEAPSLDEGGNLKADTGGEEQFNIDELYAGVCSSCHGTEGKGDGPGGAATPDGMRGPRNFTDKDWQASVDDEHIINVIVLSLIHI